MQTRLLDKKKGQNAKHKLSRRDKDPQLGAAAKKQKTKFQQKQQQQQQLFQMEQGAKTGRFRDGQVLSPSRMEFHACDRRLQGA